MSVFSVRIKMKGDILWMNSMSNLTHGTYLLNFIPYFYSHTKYTQNIKEKENKLLAEKLEDYVVVLN